jgi:peptide-methionine (S)-S-oxide reductase
MAAMAAEPVPAAGEELAVLGGGCFWCLEACYQQLKGVSKVISGYAGGPEQNPTYEQVCGKGTGHAEVVAITFNPSVITFKDLLDVFFTIHDPTTPNRQGADVGPQYRSIILYTNDTQKQTAQQAIAEANAEQLYPNPIVTEVVPLTKFWPGEAYHQNYYNDNPSQGYCRMVVGPKVAKFRSKYMAKLMAPVS